MPPDKEGERAIAAPDQQFSRRVPSAIGPNREFPGQWLYSGIGGGDHLRDTGKPAPVDRAPIAWLRSGDFAGLYRRISGAADLCTASFALCVQLLGACGSAGLSAGAGTLQRAMGGAAIRQGYPAGAAAETAARLSRHGADGSGAACGPRRFGRLRYHGLYRTLYRCCGNLHLRTRRPARSVFLDPRKLLVGHRQLHHRRLWRCLSDHSGGAGLHIRHSLHRPWGHCCSGGGDHLGFDRTF